MKNKCFDIGIIQAFIDGELKADTTENVIRHIAVCDGCAMLLAETEEETAFVFSALDDDLNCLVPTERLRTKVFTSIEEIKREEKFAWWHTLTGNLVGGLFNAPSFAAFASIFLFVCALVVGVAVYDPMTTSNGEIAKVDSPVNSINEKSLPSLNINQPDENLDISTLPKAETEILEAKDVAVSQPKAVKAVYRPAQNNVRAERMIYRLSQNNQNAVADVNPKPPAASPNLQGENTYLQTISTLSKTVDENKDFTLTPTERVSFERDLAVVNDSIKKMKEEVRKNPTNKAAREVLQSSYQNKIDLLNSVAEKSELMASMQ